MQKKIDKAASALSVIMLVLLFLDQFMFKAEARVGARIGMSAFEALGSMFFILLIPSIVLVIICFIKRNNENLCFAGALLSVICLWLSVFLEARAAMLIDETNPTGRVSMSVCAYLYIVVTFLIAARCMDDICKMQKKAVVIIAGIALIIISLVTGQFDHLAIMKEYGTNTSQFWGYFQNHLFMSFKVVIAGIAVGIPLGWLAFKKRRPGRVITAILDTIESIPSLALICVMMFPLSFISNTFPALKKMGIAGVGATPVFCALFCYSLFQIVNSVYGALKVVDAQYIDAAKGMGMNTVQIFTKVELPIILPVIISGIRVSLTATILGVTIGSYIGYGGLGKYILTGISGFKIDSVMLGTIPIICFVLLFDFVFKNLITLIEYRRKRKGVVKV